MEVKVGREGTLDPRLNNSPAWHVNPLLASTASCYSINNLLCHPQPRKSVNEKNKKINHWESLLTTRKRCGRSQAEGRGCLGTLCTLLVWSRLEGLNHSVKWGKKPVKETYSTFICALQTDCSLFGCFWFSFCNPEEPRFCRVINSPE